jgi:glycosyltransferase involved in cell wall biosynthesis
LISVIIPTFNRARLLKKAIESVLNQSYQNFELIIIDDGSTDDTDKIVSEYSGRAAYIKQNNKGPAAARNLGIEISRGDFIAFLDSDDSWDKEKLAVQISEMKKNKDYFVSHTQEIWYKNGRLLNQKKKHRKFHGYIFDKCLPMCVVGMSTAMVRKEFFEKEGFFDESFPCCEDYDFWLRASVKHPFLLIDTPLTLKDGGRTDQLSRIYATGMDKFRINAIIKILEEKELDPEQRKLAVAELSKKCSIYGNGCVKHGKEDDGRYYLNLPGKYSRG